MPITAYRLTNAGAFQIVYPNGHRSEVSYHQLDPALTEAEGIRAVAASMRERAARLLRQAEDAEACALFSEQQAAEGTERALERRRANLSLRELGRIRRADPFGFEPWASATLRELGECAAALGIAGAAGGRTFADVRSDLERQDPAADSLGENRATRHARRGQFLSSGPCARRGSDL